MAVTVGGMGKLGLSELAKRVRRGVTADARSVLRETFHGLVKASPVDTHRFQAGWRSSVGAPSDYIEPEGGAHRIPGDDDVDGALGAYKLGDDLHATNNAPYARRLAKGYSPQAERDWPKRVLRAAVAKVAADRRGGKITE